MAGPGSRSACRVLQPEVYNRLSRCFSAITFESAVKSGIWSEQYYRRPHSESDQENRLLFITAVARKLAAEAMPVSDCNIVAIVEDDDAVRQSTAGLLRRTGREVQCFTSGAEFLASNLLADFGCVLLDLHMPGMDGLSVIRILKERGKAYPIVVLTGHGDIPTAVEAMHLGAVDFLEKPYPPTELIAVIDRACAAPVSTAGSPPINRQALERISSLTERQRAVLIGILNGQPNKIIAFELGLSIRTVEAYRAQLLLKLGVRGTAEAVRLAIAAGLAAA